MRLRTKTLLVIGATMVGLVGVLYATSSTILLRSIRQAEEQNTRQSVKGVLKVFEEIGEDFSSNFIGWSTWDDTYKFISTKSDRYIEDNLAPESLANAKLNLLVYVNTKGEIVFGTGFNLITKKRTAVPKAILEHISPSDLLLQHPDPKSRLTGILQLPSGPMLITSQPIQPTKGTSDLRGTAIFGRYLDASTIKRLSRFTRSPISVYGVNDPQLPSDFQPVKKALLESKPDEPAPILVNTLDEDRIAGYSWLNDIYGKPALLLRVDVYRGIYKQTQSNIRYLIASVLFVGLVFGGMTLMLLERLVLSRLGSLSVGVKSIGTLRDLSMRVAGDGKSDELSGLADTINGMLEALENREREQIEERARHRAIVEQASEGIVLIDAQTNRILEANPAFERLLGYSSAEIVELTLYDLVPHDKESFQRNIERILAQKNHSFGERRYRRQDGTLVDVEVTGNVISYGGRKVLCCLVRDITSRKAAEEALRQAEEKYRTIFEHATEGIFQSTPEGRFISANPALARLYGYDSPEELIASITNIGQQLYVDSNRRDEFIAAIEKDDAVTRFESQMYRKNGGAIWTSENARAVRDENGNLLYYEGTVEDITRRKVAQEALRYQQEQSELLLLNILPEPIAHRLKMQESIIADSFSDVTVLFADIVGFTQLSASIPPTELVKLLNKIFSAFDQLAERHGLEKIKTIGDAYMVVGGLPMPRSDHAEAIAQMALDMLKEICRFETGNGTPFNIRIGISTGPVVAGVIGIKKFIYDLWGDTVNTASRMESQGIPGTIQVTEATYELLRDKFILHKRGIIPVKGKGDMTTYLLLGRR